MKSDPFDALPVAFGSSKAVKDPNSFKNRNRDNVSQIVANDFSKVFEFSSRKPYCFPPVESVFEHPKWKMEQLQRLKEELNSVKSKLNNYNLEDWHNHTRENNHAGTVMRALRKFQPEFLTQAWCKFYEVASRYKLVPKQSLKKKVFNSVHLCEAPGAFVASLNHFLKLNHPDIEWQWLATTLNPYYEGNDLQHMINDDRFIINTLENWWFGSDETGNLSGPNYLEDLISRVNHPVHLVTADGSVNCLGDPAEQEKQVVHLHYMETICALNILERGGSFLLKTFTMFECDTVCLMYLLRCSFTQVNVFKPVTSKEGNSEVYVVCLNYKGKNHVPILDKLNEFYYKGTSEKALFLQKDIPERFRQDLFSCAIKFKIFQTSVIERNIATYRHKNKRKRSRLQLMDIRDSTTNMFIERYKIRPISPDDFVVKNQDVDTICLNLFPRDGSGTFLDRINFKELDIKATLDFYKGKLDLIEGVWNFDNIYWFSFDNGNSRPILSLKFGKPIESLRISKFCKGNLLTIYIELNQLRTKTGTKVETSDILQSEMIKLNYDNQQCKYIDTSDASWIENCNESQKLFFNKLLDVSKTLKIGDNLILKGFPLLSQFNVGFVFLLGHYFEKIGFVNPNICDYSIIFFGLKADYEQQINDIHSSMSDLGNKGLISLIPITQLCEPKFIKCMTSINQIILKSMSLNIVKSLEETC